MHVKNLQNMKVFNIDAESPERYILRQRHTHAVVDCLDSLRADLRKTTLAGLLAEMGKAQ